MLKMKQILLLALIIFQMSLCSTTINPANYIWINYGAQIPISLESNRKYSVTLPCQARIRKCSCQFSVLPPGWEAAKDGTINIPFKDATGNGNFAIAGQFSEVTGERLNARLIATIQNGMFSVMDQDQYYKKIGYTAPDDGYSVKTTNYEESLITKNLPDGFMPISKLKSQIVEGSISAITPTINEVISNYAPCRPRLSYLKQVKSMLLDLIANGNSQINNHEVLLKELQSNLKALKIKKQTMLKTQGISKQIQTYQKQIDNLVVEISGLKINQVQLDNQVQDILNKITKYQIDVDAMTSTQLIDALGELGKVSLQLEDLYNKSLDLQQKIAMSKLQSQIKGVPQDSIPNLEGAYTTVAKMITKNKVSLVNRDLKIIDLGNENNQQAELIKVIDKYLKELDNKISTNSEKVNVLSVQNKKKKLQNENVILNQNINSLKVMVGYTKCGRIV